MNVDLINFGSLKRIIILSGQSASGGSTESFINLTNELNRLGHYTIFMTFGDYSNDKCYHRKMGHETNKQKMYDSFTDLYHYSLMESSGSVIAEAILTGKTIHKPLDRPWSNMVYELDKNIITKKWLLELL